MASAWPWRERRPSELEVLSAQQDGLAVNDGALDRQRGNGVPKAGGAFYYLRSQSEVLSIQHAEQLLRFRSPSLGAQKHRTFRQRSQAGGQANCATQSYEPLRDVEMIPPYARSVIFWNQMVALVTILPHCGYGKPGTDACRST